MNSEDVLRSQSQLINDLNAALLSKETSVNNITTKFTSQLDIVRNIENKIKLNLDTLVELNNSFDDFRKKMDKISVIKFNSNKALISQIKKIIKKKLIDNKKKSTQINNNASSSHKKLFALHQKRKELIKRAQIQIGNIKSIVKKTKNQTSLYDRTANKICEGASAIKRAAKFVKQKTKQAVSFLSKGLTMAGSLLSKIPYLGIAAKIFFSIATFTFNAISGAASVFFSLIKTVLSLPFEIASKMGEVGNVLRKKVVESLGNKIEDIKNEYDFDSYVGSSLKNLSELSKNTLLQFQDNKSKLTLMFGANNPEELVNYALESTKALGILSDHLGGYQSNIESALYVNQIQKGLGLTAEHLKYYALDSFVNITSMIETLDMNANAIMKYADRAKLDRKLVSKEFHKLRIDIVQFGHLSANELAEVSSKIVKMKLSAEDVTGIFSKISSFEDATNVSTQLFQAFGMTIDAFDMLSANDPIEIIEMLRDGMLSTGKSFETLNRHEKALLKNVTGLSDSALLTTFSYEGLTKTQSELREEMEKNDPAKIMTRSMKQMTSAVKSIVKVLKFKNPFEAISEGIFTALAHNKEFVASGVALSKAYESLERTMLGLSDRDIEPLTRPLNKIILRFYKIMTDGTLMKSFRIAVKGIGEFLTDLHAEMTDSQVDNYILDYTHLTRKLFEINNRETKKVANKALGNLRQSLELLYEKLPRQMKPILRARGLLTKSGKIKSNASLENIKEALLSASMSENRRLANRANKILESKFNVEELVKQINAANKDPKTVKKVRSLMRQTGLSRITAKLYETVSALLGKGQPLFTDIYRLAQDIAKGLIKGFFVGSTSLLYIINGKLEKANELLQKHGEELKEGESFFLKILGIDQKEMSSMADQIKIEANKIGQLGGNNLYPAFKLVLNHIIAAKDMIINLLKQIIFKTAANLYMTSSSKSTKKAIETFFPRIASSARLTSSLSNITTASANEQLKTSGYITSTQAGENLASFKLSQRMTKLKSIRGTNVQLANTKAHLGKLEHFFDKSSPAYKEMKYFANNLRLYDLDIFYENGKRNRNHRLKQYKKGEKLWEKISPLLKDEASFLTYFNKPENRNELQNFIQQFNFAIDITKGNRILNSQELAAYADYKDKKIDKEKLEKILSVNDIVSTDIQLHASDIVEVIGSKPGGLLQEYYHKMSVMYKRSLESIKVLIKREGLNRDELDYIQDETLLEELFEKLNTYIKDSKENNKIVVSQSGIKVVE